MMIFFKERLAFLSVPKTGSTAYESALLTRADIIISDPPALKHAPVYRYNRWLRPMFLRVCDVELELMAVMREPVSWLSSWWRYRQRAFMEGRPNATIGISFDEFVEAYMRGKRPSFAEVGSQAEFLAAQPNGTSVTHLFRYEDQGGIQNFLQERLETQFSLEQENVSPKLDATLAPNVLSKFKRKCGAEFALYDSIG